jgi:thiol-disulfide isomerase/thioredoxin
MKIRSILFATSVVAILASCGGKVSDVTEISGTVLPEGISEVNVTVGEVVDTLVPVVDGKFSLTVPADVTALASVQAGNYGANFISDGTPLEVVLGEDTAVTSKYADVSVQEKLNAYNAKEQAFMDEYMAKQREIFADTLLSQDEKNAKFEAYYDEFIEPYVNHHVEAAKANPDNFISVFALSNLRSQIEDPQMAELVDALVPALQESRYVSGMKQALDARLNTAEGKPFVDFTVNSVVGMTRSIPPQPKYAEVKFSDYVGKGKYILVDFWAPWCGPCKREIPNLKAVYDKYAGEKFDILSIAVWERQPVQVTIDTAAELGMNWSHINNAGSVPTDIYGVEGIPHLMLIGPDGTILKRGFHGAEGIEAAVAEYLK